jgi:hypothetical protein
VIVTQRTEESNCWKSKDRNKRNQNQSCYQLNSKEEEEDQKKMKKKQQSQPGSQCQEE